MEPVVAMVVASAALRPEAAVAAMLFAAGMGCLRIIRRACERPHRRQSLRRCPLCAADAVRALECEVMERRAVRVLQQCGQCSVWRETVTVPRRAERHKRRLETDQIQIRRCAELLDWRARKTRPGVLD